MMVLKCFVTLAFIILSSKATYSQENRYQKEIDLANKWNSEQFTIVKKNFSFTYDCDTSDIKIVVLLTGYEKSPNAFTTEKEMASAKIVASTVGVSGCNNKAVYIKTSSGWVVNNTAK